MKNILIAICIFGLGITTGITLDGSSDKTGQHEAPFAYTVSTDGKIDVGSSIMIARGERVIFETDDPLTKEICFVHRDGVLNILAEEEGDFFQVEYKAHERSAEGLGTDCFTGVRFKISKNELQRMRREWNETREWYLPQY